MTREQALKLFFGDEARKYHPQKTEFIIWLYARGYVIIEKEEYKSLSRDSQSL